MDRSKPPNRKFVVQQHRARTLHYDLRLERDGVFVKTRGAFELKKTAVPEPSTLTLSCLGVVNLLAYAGCWKRAA
jgi:hypothetical protein